MAESLIHTVAAYLAMALLWLPDLAEYRLGALWGRRRDWTSRDTAVVSIAALLWPLIVFMLFRRDGP